MKYMLCDGYEPHSETHSRPLVFVCKGAPSPRAWTVPPVWNKTVSPTTVVVADSELFPSVQKAAGVFSTPGRRTAPHVRFGPT